MILRSFVGEKFIETVITMKSFSDHKLLLLVFILPFIIFGFDSGQLPDTSQKQGVKFVGLTKTLTNLLKTRTPKSFFIGAYEISMESLVDNDIAAVFDCDSVIDNYLSEAGEGATYEMLSDEMRNSVWDRFDSEDGSLFVNVYSDTTSDGVYFNFSIEREKPVFIPVVLNASDSSFSTSFDTMCSLIFEADIDLFINTRMAIADSQSQATRIRINRFMVELSSAPDNEFQPDDYDYENQEEHDLSDYIQKPQKPIPFEIESKKYCAVARYVEIYAGSYWYLTPADATSIIDDDEQCYTLSYEQLEKGEFKWDNEYLSSFNVNLVMIPEVEKWDSVTIENNSTEFSYTVDNLFDDNGLEQISFCCDYWVKDSVTARNKKFILE